MWVKTMEQLVAFLGEDAGITLAEDLTESIAGMLEYTNEFSQLSNARMPPPPCMPEVRTCRFSLRLFRVLPASAPRNKDIPDVLFVLNGRTECL